MPRGRPLTRAGILAAALDVIDADGLDFQDRPEDFASITDKIDSELYGLF